MSDRRPRRRLALLLGGALAAATACAQPPLPAGVLQQAPATIVWRPAPPGMPAGTQIAVLEGDPKQAGLFTLRLRVPAGARIAPHWHPQPERVTVLEGSLRIGFGERFDEQRLTALPAGSYYVNPPQTPHFLDFPVAALVQITTQGPWEVHYLDAP